MAYIEREELLKKAIKERRFVFQMEDLLNNEVIFKTVYKDLAEFINSIPAADVAPVRHGRWIWHSEERGYLCSECRSGCLLNYESDWHESDWCPHCGAKMDGGTQNEQS